MRPALNFNVSVDQAVNVGIGLIASIVVIIALIVIIILLISNRKAVARAGQKMGSQVSTIASRMTQRIGAGPKQARAQLEVLAGGQVGKHYDLYGKTTIGRDPQKAQLALENPLISREHCTFHLDMNAGKWTIEDLESSNGTYLNSQLLAPHQKKELKNGDTIDIAPIPKGGIRLRFLILVTPLATVTLKQGAQTPSPQVPDPYATRKGITPPPPPTGAPTAPSGTPQAPATGIPTVPQPAGKPTIPQPQPKPTIPQPTGTPTIPQPQGKPRHHSATGNIHHTHACDSACTANNTQPGTTHRTACTCSTNNSQLPGSPNGTQSTSPGAATARR